MKNIFWLMFIFLVLIFVVSCSKKILMDVTTVSEGEIEGIGERDLAQLREIKDAIQGEKEDIDLIQIIQSNPNYTIREYLTIDPEASNLAANDYQVGGYDVLNISVYEEPDLSLGEAQVSAKGFISFPLLGRIEVEGMTAQEIEALIARELVDRGLILNAQVTVTVIGFNSKSYSRMGAGGGGKLPLSANIRVLDALSGGVDFEVAQKEGWIIRTLNAGTDKETKIIIHLDLSEFIKGGIPLSNIPLKDKDIVYIPKPQYYYIIRAVGGAGKYPYNQKEVTLLDAIIQGGGFNPIDATNRIRIIRVEDGKEKMYKVNLDNMVDTGSITKDFIIKPGDVIYIPESYF
ncbi:polysaccharide biosynthesis/export family protein [Desulfobacterales bacterium HSG16]|nr:polysaccharide biosynthesis/export family protein [Desulfobacterales bacterium HSG16]